MNMIDQRIADQLPAYFREYYPRFVTFLSKYYEWLYRTSGLSTAEIDDLTSDTSWLQQDIDQFIKTGQLKFFDQTAEPNLLQAAITIENNTQQAGAISSNLLDNFLMEGDFNGEKDIDGTETTGQADPSVEYPTVENDVLDSWFNSMGFDRIRRSKLKSLSNIDQVLMISLLKHIYAIKGTEASIKLFFSLMFEEEVWVFQPKTRIAVVDEHFILEDLDTIIRDDEEYQEFSYVIIVPGDPAKYQDVLQTIYMNTIHPAGFRVALRQETFDPSLNGILLEDGSGYLLLESGVYLAQP